MAVLIALTAGCSSDGVELKPGTSVVYVRTVIGNIGQIETVGVSDLAADGDDVAVLIHYGYTIFFEHPDLVPSSNPDPGTGSSSASGGWVLAVSRDRGATFTSSPIYTADGEGGEPLGLHLEGGRGWLVLRINGVGDALPLRVRELDLDTATLAPATADQDFFWGLWNASTTRFDGDKMAAHVSMLDETGTTGFFGFQELDLATGVFTDRVNMFAFDGCYATLYPDAAGMTWTGYRSCLNGEVVEMCRFDTAFSEGVPSRVCIPTAEWPAIADNPVIVTDAGPAVVYTRDGDAFAAQIRGSAAVEIPLGEGEVLSSGGRQGAMLRTLFGSLIPVGTGFVKRLVAVRSAGAFDLPLPWPCADEADCPANVVFVLPLGGDDYLSIWDANLHDNRQEHTFLFRRDTLVGVPVAGGSGPSPVPGCPDAVAASPLVEACALASACLPALDLRNCLDDWSTTLYGPTTASLAAFEATTTCAQLPTTYPRASWAYAATCTPGCYGNTAVETCSTNAGPHQVVDCAARGMTCSAGACVGATPGCTANCGAFGRVCEAGLCVEPGCEVGLMSCEGDVSCFYGTDCGAIGLPCTDGRCEDTTVNEGCPSQACAGDFLVIDLGYEKGYVDCTAIGYRTCDEPFPGFPRCIQ